jgi:hypothetical protein
MNTRSVEATPAEAVARLSGLPAHTPILVDLDETLWLENSTERFLDQLRPSSVFRVLLWLMDVLKPWRIYGGLPQRPFYRLLCVLLLAPWTYWRWRKVLATLAPHYANHALLQALQGRKVVVVSFGFDFIVRPLVAALRPQTPVIACRFGFADRRLGKPALLIRQQKLLQDTFGAGFSVDQAAFITDSSDDADLLAQVAHPLRVVWPEATCTPALAWAYAPLVYSERLRRPNQRYFLRAPLQDEYTVSLLAAWPVVAAPLWLVPGFLLLLLGLWCLYEQGYVDNDDLSRRFPEDNHGQRDRPEILAYGRPVWQPFLWCLGFSVLGLFAVQCATGKPWPLLAASWAGILLAVAVFYYLYNRLNRRTRVVIFAGFHALRLFALSVLTGLSKPGFFMLLSVLVHRQFEDYLAKLDLQKKPDPRDLFLIRTYLFVLFVAADFLLFGYNHQDAVWATALLAYAVFRARREWRAFFHATQWLGGANHAAKPEAKPQIKGEKG